MTPQPQRLARGFLSESGPCSASRNSLCEVLNSHGAASRFLNRKGGEKWRNPLPANVSAQDLMPYADFAGNPHNGAPFLLFKPSLEASRHAHTRYLCGYLLSSGRGTLDWGP